MFCNLFLNLPNKTFVNKKKKEMTLVLLVWEFHFLQCSDSWQVLQTPPIAVPVITAIPKVHVSDIFTQYPPFSY